jgi:hypothetical protein
MDGILLTSEILVQAAQMPDVAGKDGIRTIGAGVEASCAHPETGAAAS